MKIIQTLLILATLFLLTACETTQPTVEYRNNFISIPSALTVDCEVTEPPDIDLYIEAEKWELKEKMLNDAYSAQTNNLNTCNKRFARLREWNQNQGTIFTPTTSLPTVTGVQKP